MRRRGKTRLPHFRFVNIAPPRTSPTTERIIVGVIKFSPGIPRRYESCERRVGSAVRNGRYEKGSIRRGGPLILPPARPVVETCDVACGHAGELARDGVDGKVVLGVLHASGQTPRVVARDVLQHQVIIQRAASLFRRAVPSRGVRVTFRENVRVLEHSSVRFLPVDGGGEFAEVFDVRVADDHVCVGAALHAAVPVCGATRRVVAFVGEDCD